MSVYSIKDLERVSGIKAHTIRIWEQRYGILKPERSETNIRHYSNTELRLLLNVSFLNNNGFKISHIAKMDTQQMCKEVLRISESTYDYSNFVDSLVVAMVDMNEEVFERMLSKVIDKLSFETTFSNVIFPLLRKIGIMWQAHAINPAQEHFISNLIRQKIIVAIDSQQTNYNPDATKFLLFLPEGELHELGLLFLNYVIRSRQGHSLYMGQSLPYEDIVKVVELYKPDYVCGVITYSINGFHVDEYVQLLSSDLINTNILLTGNAAITNKDNLEKFPNVKVFNTMEVFIDFIEEKC
jgi:DNA-binding transcriptional MerR regulator